ncbi:MAG TPA: 16S rRNA (guanine(527)-N(7))-methyltransferase RsmG [Ruminococcus flavefaciens]|nr:16S rRNA (guanine(527)-N(7))-methyltransferase RsmG [Ruminococcus flavefaciens]
MLPDFDFCRNAFTKYELDLTEEMYRKFDIYAEFLVEYNKNVNLTAITDPVEILYKHFIDSVLMLKYAEIKPDSSVIDVGTGAGFPSVPAKIYDDSLKITLLDSLNKRIFFLQQLCEKLQIDAEFVHGRAEDIAKLLEYREKFDISCARAVANMSLLSEFCLPFVGVGGRFIALKGPNEDISSGLNAVKILGGDVSRETNYDVEGDSRKIVIVNKISQTPPKYPRNSAQIKKKSL